jgi:hypothetical protein
MSDARPIEGFGRMWQKTYRVRLPGCERTPAQVVTEWRLCCADLSPAERARTSAATAGLVEVRAEPESLTFTTSPGHAVSRWVTFSAAESAGVVTAQVQELLRARDPLSELGLALGGHRREERSWQHALAVLAAALGAQEAEVETHVVCVDRRRRWSRAAAFGRGATVPSARA